MTDQTVTTPVQTDDYSFREAIYDATSEAEKKSGIHVVIADWQDRKIECTGPYPSIEAADGYIEYQTQDYVGVQTFIIGGDLLDG